MNEYNQHGGLAKGNRMIYALPPLACVHGMYDVYLISLKLGVVYAIHENNNIILKHIVVNIKPFSTSVVS